MDCRGTSSTTSLRTRAVKKRRQTRAVWRCLSGILARMLRWHPSCVSHPMLTPTRSRTFACTPYADRQTNASAKQQCQMEHMMLMLVMCEKCSQCQPECVAQLNVLSERMVVIEVPMAAT